MSIRGEGRAGGGIGLEMGRRRRRENVHEIRKNNRVLKGTSDPDQVQRILIDADLAGERAGVVRAQKGAPVRVDADAEVADAHFELGAADDVGDGRRHARVDLRRVVGGRVFLVIERYQEDAGYQG